MLYWGRDKALPLPPQLLISPYLDHMNNESSPLVSLIVVTYNSAPLLPAFFAALATTRYAPYEVLVVDNASQDGTPQLVGTDYPAARLLANRENLGFGRACNRGARAAHGQLLVFLN